MPFPKVQRVKYSKSPLENVVCQLRFPPILEIDFQAPYAFQNEIRDIFPIYEERMEIQQEISPAVVNQIMNPVTNMTTNKNHQFMSEDGIWIINLTRTFISISTNKYTTWENMLAAFDRPLSALINVYKPAFFSRVGLRYIDVFCRSVLNLSDCAWSDLINPQFLGLLASEDLASSVKEMNNVYDVECEDKESHMRIATNLAKKIDTNEECFLMDSDVYTTSKVTIEEVRGKLGYLHDRSSRLVRYAITEKLHEGMEPENI